MLKKTILGLLLATVIIPAAGLLWAIIVLPDPLFDKPYSTIVEDKNGKLLGARIADDEQWRFPAPDSLTTDFVQSLLLFEDRYFFRHPGVNPVSLFRALRQNVATGRVVSGGSTITMQVIRLSRENPDRTIPEKIREIFLAFALELRHPKKEILTLYATHAPFGGNVVGIETAAWRYYNRPPEILSLAESAALAVLPNSPALIFPGRNEEIFREKRNLLLKRMHTAGFFDELSLQLSLEEPLPGRPHTLPVDAPHLLDRYISEGGKGRRLHSTLDAHLQRRAANVMLEHRKKLETNQIHHAAALIADVRTGEILAYVGNSGEPGRRGSQVDIIRAERSPGSTLKPMLYFLQLNEGNLLPDMLVPDVPTRVAGYAPRNFNPVYDGSVPASQALARSLNVPAVRNLQAYGLQKFHHQLKMAGFSTLRHPPEHYGLTLILGGAEVTMWDLAKAYLSMAMTLENYSPVSPSTKYWKEAELNFVTKNSDRHRYNELFPVHPSAIWHTFEAMHEAVRPAGEVNWNQFVTSKRIAWKTGTSVGFRDAWAVGITPEYLVIVWAGNADGEGRPGLTGLSAAAPAMFDLFQLLDGTSWFREPVFDMSYATICTRSGHLAGADCHSIEYKRIPPPGTESALCPYHRNIHVNTAGTHRVNSSCYSMYDMESRPWFVLPPVQEWYYRAKNVYEPLPPWLAGCSPPKTAATMDLIYPDVSSVIYVPVEIDGQKGRTVFEAAHRSPNATIFWHLDELFLGQTRGIHQMPVSPEPGHYTLTLVDEQGETLQREIQILGSKNR